MKNLKYLILLCVSAAGFFMLSCNELDTVPYEQLASGSMYTDEATTDAGVIGVYNVLRQEYVAGGSGIGLALIDSWGVNSDSRDASDVPLNTAKASNTTGTFQNYWKQHYYGVFRANTAIASIPKSPVSDAKKARLIAECRFLRAYFYYRLNMVFKGVPYYEGITEISEMTKGRETEAFIWDKIIEDLTACAAETNLPDRYDAGDGNFGRITQGAVQALLGKVYLWRQEYDKAETAFKALEAMGYELFAGAGADSYRQLFKEANEQSKEAVFALQCVGLSGQGQAMSFRYGGRTTYGSCWNTILPNTDFVDSYENIDGSQFNWDDIIPGYTAKTPAERKVYFYRDKDAVEPFKDASGKSAYDILVQAEIDYPTEYLPTGNEARIKSAYENRDPRLKMTIITPYSTYLGIGGGVDQTLTLRWPCWNSDAVEPFDIRTDTPGRFHYLYRKFVAEGNSEIPNREYSPIDLPIIRYADVLLMWAEALVQTGDLTGAKAKVKQVRDRVGMPTSDASFASKSAALRYVQDERRREFVNEGINFFDEMRWRTLKEMKYGDSPLYDKGYHNLKAWGANSNGIKISWPGDHTYVWAVPKAEADKNTNLTKTPGWIY